jgi:hypothetical protein
MHSDPICSLLPASLLEPGLALSEHLSRQLNTDRQCPSVSSDPQFPKELKVVICLVHFDEGATLAQSAIVEQVGMNLTQWPQPIPHPRCKQGSRDLPLTLEDYRDPVVPFLQLGNQIEQTPESPVAPFGFIHSNFID